MSMGSIPNGTSIFRRGLLKYFAGSALGLGLAVPAAVSSHRALAQNGKGQINFMTWGGSFGKAVRAGFSDPFTQATGIVVNDITPFNLGKFETAMRHGNPEGYDLAWFNDEVDPLLAGGNGLVEPLNYDWMPHAATVVASARQKYGAAPYVTSYLLCYNKNVIGNKTPSGWRDFWDVQNFPGPRSLGTWVVGVLEAALMADGVAKDKLYPLDEDRAFTKLNQIKPSIRVFHDTQSNQAIQQMLNQGDVGMVLTWGTDTVMAQVAGKPVGAVFNEGFYFSPLVGIAKGSKYLKECHQYLDSFFIPENEAKFVDIFAASPANPAVLGLMKPERRSLTATANFDKMVNFNVDYYAKNRARLQQKYDSWRIA
jgi:putative spermidine/putrescine transport system substrate-binding protein